jgi:aryl-alcohol dehydrogenase-like predicted oxidoreductase
MMKYRELALSGIKTSEIGFGCMSLDMQSSGNSQLLMSAVDQGITYFDTADLYGFGANERIVGAALVPVRQQVVIATKIGNQWNQSQTSWKWNADSDYLKRATEASLKRLGTDYLDILQLHGGTLDDNYLDVVETFVQLQDQGKIRAFGISSIRPNVIQRYCENGKISSNMAQYSLLDRRPEEETLERLAKAKISVFARGVLAKGVLAAKSPVSYLNYSESQVAHLLDKLRVLGSIQAIAQQYILRKPVVASAVVGIRNQAQLEKALACYQEGVESTYDWAEIEKILPAERYKDHRVTTDNAF